MGWFDEQIKQRIENDEEVYEDSFLNIAGSVMGHHVVAALKNESRQTKDAIEEILKYYHVKSREIPPKMTDVNEQLEYLMRPYGIMRRNVVLEKGWYRDAMGAMLGVRKSDGSIVDFIPKGTGGYTFLDSQSGKRIKVNEKNEDLFEKEAIAFYVPFPLRKLGLSDLVRYIIGTLSVSDYVLMILVSLIVTVIGMLTPEIYSILFSDVLVSGNMSMLLTTATFLICITVGSVLFRSVKSLVFAKIETKLSITVEAATMMRILSLPANFFQDYSAGDLSQRIQYVNILCNVLTSVVFQTSLTSVFSLIYISQIYRYAPSLAFPALCIVLITILFSFFCAYVQMRESRKKMEITSKQSGMSFALISGIQKIKLSGAEKRAFARWGNLYAKQAEKEYNPPLLLKLNHAISTAIQLTGMMVLYYIAAKSQISVADYFAFNAAYGMVSAAFMSFASVALAIADIRPILEIIRPILDAEPEVSEGKQVVTRLSGSIELNNIFFRYKENMPLILDDLSLKIRPGQYVAIVGKTGCGKSTLMRLLLGFEKPQKGAIYYDGKDIKSMDLKSLRQKIGVVTQNGKLFQGDIFSNIAISAPHITMEEAWEAASLAGMAEDIQNMPMGMFTMISEGSGGISGGQRQRLLIARAIAGKPRILMFDEATSALDNVTQKIVSDSLAHLKCTRIVIAHRLSTIKECDRIIVLDKGKIVEDGTYDELIALNGQFTELVSRQKLD